MQLYQKIPLIFENKDYEIRLLFDEKTVSVMAFRNNYPANGFRHQIQIPKTWDARSIMKSEVVNELVELTKKDIVEKKWDRLRNSIK